MSLVVNLGFVSEIFTFIVPSSLPKLSLSFSLFLSSFSPRSLPLSVSPNTTELEEAVVCALQNAGRSQHLLLQQAVQLHQPRHACRHLLPGRVSEDFHNSGSPKVALRLCDRLSLPDRAYVPRERVSWEVRYIAVVSIFISPTSLLLSQHSLSSHPLHNMNYLHCKVSLEPVF